MNVYRAENKIIELSWSPVATAAAHSQSALVRSQTNSSSLSRSHAESMRFGGKMASSKRGIVSLGMSGFCFFGLLEAHLCSPFLFPTS